METGSASVTIDGQALLMQRRGGISRYFVELIKRESLFSQLGIELRTPWPRVSSDYAIEALPGRFSSVPSGWLGTKRRQLALHALSLSTHRVRLCHHSHYNPYFLRLVRAKCRISTIHDMMPELFASTFTGQNPHQAKRDYVERSDLVICVSQKTAEDLQSIYSVDDAKIRVIPLGVDFEFFNAGKRSPRLVGYPYVLYVGSRSGQKNFDLLLKALSQPIPPDGQLRLLAVGGGPFTGDEESRIKALGLGDRVAQVSLLEKQLPSAYAYAECCVIPSLYEGFGLPVLEAMAAGCPTILSTGGSLPEVGGKAAIYFQPDDPDELNSALDSLLSSQTKRKELQQAGAVRARSFSWQRTAEATADVYRETL